jgi:2-polyprenyl-3-methyl-5-hydroxy-6-metoxy-1,4-benzoquinol methylase
MAFLNTATRRIRYFCVVCYRTMAHPDGRCAYCLSENTALIGRKFGVVQIRRCAECGLMFRWPKDSEIFNFNFYQSRYFEPEATELPAEADVSALAARNFAGTFQDRGKILGMLEMVKPPPATVLDYGCSWGYGLHQLSAMGYDSTGFEISKARAAFGRQTLKLNIIDSLDELDALPPARFDIIHSSHVLEHLPSLNGLFERFTRLLRHDGMLVLSAPNCGDGVGGLREGWKPIVGEKHAMALDTMFFRNVLPRYGYNVVALTSPYKSEDLRAGASSHADNGAELLVVARRG